MSMNFSANQYERSFRAEHLGNWEVSKRYPLIRPRQRKGYTKIIADDRGHLLPGVPRIEPWGHFKSTWQLPRKITRKIAKELSTPVKAQEKPQSSWEKRSSHIPLVDPKQGSPTESKQETSAEPKQSTPSLPPAEKEKRVSSARKSIPVVDDIEKLNEYQLYDKDEHDYSHPMGCDGNPKVVNTVQRVKEDLESYKKSIENLTEKKDSFEALMSNNGKNSLDSLKAAQENNQLSEIPDDRDKHSETSRKSSSKRSSARSSRSSSKSSRRGSTGKKGSEDVLIKSPELVVDYIPSQYAKVLAQDNLKHHPLPDTIDHNLFRALQMKRDKNPGNAIENTPTAVAVGKKYLSPGPTQCSKLKVYRPKTAGGIGAMESIPLEEIERPKTCRVKDLHEIDLALCWDLVPEKPEDEPRRPAHIDGSNGSLAPSVFSVVKPKHDEQDQKDISKKSSPKETKCTDPRHKPKTAWAENIKPPKIVDRTVNPSAVMDIINTNDEVIGNQNHLRRTSRGSANLHAKDLVENQNPNIQDTPPSKHSNSEDSKKGSHNTTLDTSINSDKLLKQKHYRSSPNLYTHNEHHLTNNKLNKLKQSYSRPCVACDIKNPNDISTKLPKSDYKMAFKAGVPNSSSNRSKSGSLHSSKGNGSHTVKQLSVPKPKTPFARKSYSINTLIPPFSLWPGTTGMDYPEHWRLASVYQHSYKPVELRKKPLLQSVFH